MAEPDAGPPSFAIVCEADADRRTASELADRVLREAARGRRERSTIRLS